MLWASRLNGFFLSIAEGRGVIFNTSATQIRGIHRQCPKEDFALKSTFPTTLTRDCSWITASRDQLIRLISAGKKVLNLFCYTGAFSVYAAAGQASDTISVDLSKNYLQWARRNMALNGFSGKNHRYVCDDAMAFLSSHCKGQTYDLAIVDPPTFSNRQEIGGFLGHRP